MSKYVERKLLTGCSVVHIVNDGSEVVVAALLPLIAAEFLLSYFQTPKVYDDLLSWKVISLLGFENPSNVQPWIGSIFGAIIGGGLLYLVAFVYEVVRRRQGLGMGDVKMMAMVGAFLGWRLALMTIFVGSLLGTFVGIFLILLRKIDTQGKLAFGVFLGIGSALCLFYGFSFVRWYLDMPR